MAEIERGKPKWWLLFKAWFIAEDPDEDGEVRGFCPFHEDEIPSAHWNVQKEVMHCKACGKGWNFYNIAKAVEEGEVHPPHELDRERAKVELSRKVRTEKPKVELTKAMAERWHDALLQRQDRFLWLVTHRGIFDVTIYDKKIGWDEEVQRFTIPIFDEDGELQNVRKYRPNGRIKMVNTEGYGSPARLFPIQTLINNDRILLTEGEWDALIADQYGVPSVTSTGGAGRWEDWWTPYFRGKHVVIIYDNDKSGHEGSRLAASKLYGVAESVSIASVPISRDGADVADLFNVEGYSRQGLLDLMDSAKPYFEKSGGIVAEEEPTDLPLLGVPGSFKPELVGKVFDMRAQVVSRHGPPFYTPARVEFSCTQDYGKSCAVCPMSTKFNGHSSMEIEQNNLAHMDVMLRDNRVKIDAVLAKMRGIPRTCGNWTHEIERNYDGECLIVQDQPHGSANIDGVGGTPNERLVYNIGSHNTREGETVILRGTTLPHPRTQEAIMFAWESKPDGLDMDKFEMDEHTRSLLRRFQVKEGQRPLEKMEEIAHDLSANVTRIYGRPDLHVAFDIVMHSVLNFKYRGDIIKGRIDAAAIGDTRTGKTRAAQKVCEHYGAGAVVNCETASLAGLIGTTYQAGSKSNNSWSVKWGAFPMNDRRALVLDEASGLVKDGSNDVNLFSQLTGIRESGMAQITKAGSASAQARIRMWWMMNTLTGKSLSATSFGVLEFQDLVKKREDVARFDFVLGLSSDEVPQDVINATPVLQQVYTSQACHALLMWAWSRTPDQVIFTKEAEAEAVAASSLADRYTEEVPLIQRANVSEKVARIAVAIAARTFSTDETSENVVVTKEHVEDAVDFLDQIYMKECFGYYHLSKSLVRRSKVAEGGRDQIIAILSNSPSLKTILATNRVFSDRTLSSVAGGFTSDGRRLLGEFIRLGYVEKVSGNSENYSATPELNRLLKEI